MTTYARIENDRIAELVDFDPAGKFHPDLVWADATNVEPAPQVNWSATREGDKWTFAPPPPPPPPTLAERAAAALAAGCAVVSASDPTLNATYPMDEKSLDEGFRTSQFIQINNRFPAGQARWPVPDVAGNIHFISSPAMFQAASAAVYDYAAALKLIIGAGANAQGDLPPQPVHLP